MKAAPAISGLVGLLCWSALLAGCAGRRPSSVDPVRPPNLRSTVDALLDRAEPPVTDEDWKRLPPEALDLLAQTQSDTSASPEKRLRAIAAMAHVNNPAASEELKRLWQRPPLDISFRSAALLAYAERMGNPAVGELKPVLADSDWQLRQAGARALARIGTKEARDALEDRLGREDAASVRDVIQQALTMIEP
jgi:HEAT repeat protein